VAVGRVFLERGVVAEGDGAAGAVEDGVAAVVGRRVETEGLAGEAGGDHGLDEAEGRERVFAAGLEDDRDLHREGREPERVDAGAVAREEDAEAVGLREEIYGETVLVDDARVENIERQAAGEAVDDLADVGHGGVDFRHVAPAEAVGETGELGERGDVIVGALEFGTVAPREITVEEEFGGFLHVADERLAGNRLKGLDAAGELREIAADEAGVGDADFDGALADGELDACRGCGRLAEAEDGNVDRAHAETEAVKVHQGDRRGMGDLGLRPRLSNLAPLGPRGAWDEIERVGPRCGAWGRGVVCAGRRREGTRGI
jgi:hypothetical protein